MPELNTNSRFLVDSAWLQEHLEDADLRILDCTVYLPNYFEESAQKKVEIVPGLQDYQRSHIPGSVYVDLVGDLTDKSNKRFMFPMPPGGSVRERDVPTRGGRWYPSRPV